MPSGKSSHSTGLFYDSDVEKLSHQMSFQPIEPAGIRFLTLMVRYEVYDAQRVDDIEDVCQKFCG
jgi:hypothetical protein